MVRQNKKTKLEGLLINRIEKLQRGFKEVTNGIEVYNNLRNEYLHEGINIQIIHGEDLEIYNKILENIKEDVESNRDKLRK